MNRPLVSRLLAWLAFALVACSEGKHGESAGVDTGAKPSHVASHSAPPSTPDATVAMDSGSMPAAQVAMDAGQMPEASYTIYPVEGNECPGKPFPPGFEVLPTRVCPGAGGPCHDEVCYGAADCTKHPRGRCAGFDEGAGAIQFTRCIYEGCESHADCDAGSVCLCGAGWRSCVLADCTSDSDCPAGEHCMVVDAPCTPGAVFVCTSPADQCRTAADCPRGNACLAEQRGTPLTCSTIICD